MDIKSLQEQLDQFKKSLNEGDRELLQTRLKSLISAYPFNDYEYALMYFLEKKVIDFAQYEELRNSYVSSNKYLELYGLAPRIFGEIWGQQHIKDLDIRFLKPDKNLDPSYAGEYDLFLDGLKVEVKAARAIDTKKRGDLVSKALQRNSAESFWMNFQQIKFEACDVFIFIGVWADEIHYWVLSCDEVKSNKYLSHQHRGGIEYQIGITDKNISSFDIYQIEPSKIYETIIQKSKAK